MKPTQTRTPKRKWFAIGGLGVISGLVALGILSGTLARYTYSEPLSDTARVAVFDVGVGDGSRTFSLFDTIYDSEGGGSNIEDDVAQAGAGETAIIAPGTRGSFALALYNNSEVNVIYTVELAVGKTAIPLKFSTDGSTWTDDLTSAMATDTLLMNDTETVTVHWEWPFNSDDTTDTRLGMEAQTNPETVTVDATVTFVQKD